MVTEMNEETTKQARFRVLPTGDTKSRFYNNNRTAKEVLAELGYPRYLLSSSAKTRKSEGVGVLSKVLYLTSGIFCPKASPACLTTCLGHSSGRMPMQRSTDARDRRSALFLEDRDYFLQLLRSDIFQLRHDTHLQGMIASVRLNGTSDLPWERIAPELFSEFHDVQFYDYTKIAPRYRSYLSGKLGEKDWPSNYTLCFSVSEKNGEDATAFLKQGGTVAAVFHPYIPQEFKGVPVINGDKHDARWLDGKSVVVGLSAKGIAEQDLSGFVLRVA